MAKKKAAKKKTIKKSTKPRKPKDDKPPIEKVDVEVTPYPRAGDNKDFEDILDRVGLERESSSESKPATPAMPAKPAGPASGDEILSVADVAEWVAWPFLLWAQSNELPGLSLSTKEAKSIAEPLTSILNRHETGKVIPPDVVDALRAGARLTPVMAERVAMIKKERDRQAAGASPDNHKPGPSGKKDIPKDHIRVEQGARATKPKEV